MNKAIFAAVIAFSLTSLVFAQNRNVGNGNAGITNATIKFVCVLNNNVVQFQINDTSSSVLPGRQWYFDGGSAWGKNALSILLTAKACGIPVMFWETTSQTWGWGCTQFMMCNWN